MIRWGKAGAGILFFCGNEVLLLLRSANVLEPLTWGIPGGSVSGEKYFSSSQGSEIELPLKAYWEGAKKEAQEELGSIPSVQPFAKVVYTNQNFTYTTFFVRISEEERENWHITLNWENIQYRWFPMSMLPRRLHYGVDYLVKAHPEHFEGFSQASSLLVDLPKNLYHGTSFDNLLGIISYGGLSPGRGASPHRTITKNALFYSDDPQAALLYADQLQPVILKVDSEKMDIEPDWDDASALIEIDLQAISEELNDGSIIGLGDRLTESQEEKLEEIFEWTDDRSEPWTTSIRYQDGNAFLSAEPFVSVSINSDLLRTAPEIYDDCADLSFQESGAYYVARQYLSYQELYLEDITAVLLTPPTIAQLKIPDHYLGDPVGLINYSVIPGIEDLDLDTIDYGDPRLEELDFKQEVFYPVNIYRLREFLNGNQMFLWRRF